MSALPPLDLSWGALSIRKQRPMLPEEEIRRFTRLLDCIDNLFVAHVLTDPMAERAKKRLASIIDRAVRDAEKGKV